MKSLWGNATCVLTILTVFVCSHAAQGETGVAGPQGEIGVTGAQGEIGVTGSQGEIGVTGSQGEIGVTGSQGETGVAGPQGEIGVTGPQGETGVTGPQGEIGVTGSQGETGVAATTPDLNCDCTLEFKPENFDLEHKAALGEEFQTFLADTEFPIRIYDFFQEIATRLPDWEMMSTEVVLTKDYCERNLKNMHYLNAYWLVKCDDVYVSEWS